MSFQNLTIQQLATQLATGDLTSKALTQACLERIKATNDQLNSFITVCEQEALVAAEAADDRLAAGNAPLLTGIPLALKDIFNTLDVRTTCGSKILDNYVAPYDATVVRKLREQGADDIPGLKQRA